MTGDGDDRRDTNNDAHAGLRGPRVFDADDGQSQPFGGGSGPTRSAGADRSTDADGAEPGAAASAIDPSSAEAGLGSFALPNRSDLARGFRWDSLFVSAFVGLFVLALGVWFGRFISAALASGGWVGFLSTSLLVLLCVAGTALAIREALGFWRLGRLEAIQARV
ncbi:MAG: hypothetical protein AAFR55_10310, partial [Pseudomonadota bacterium]